MALRFFLESVEPTAVASNLVNLEAIVRIDNLRLGSWAISEEVKKFKKEHVVTVK